MLGANPVPEGPTEDMTPGGLAINAISCIFLKKIINLPGGQIDELSGRVLLFFFILTSNSLVLVSSSEGLF